MATGDVHISFMIDFVKSIEAGLRKMIEETVMIVDKAKDSDLLQTYIERMRVKQSILNHPRRKKARLQLYDDGEIGCFKVEHAQKEVTYAGLTRTIAKSFFTYDDDIDKTSEDFVEIHDVSNDVPYDTDDECGGMLSKDEVPKNRFLCKCLGHPRKHGTNVHNEMNKFVELLHEPGEHGMAGFFRAVSKNPEDSEYADGCTLHLLRFLVKTRLIPVASEYLVFDEKIQVATQVDMICVNADTLEVSFIEIKTGYGDANNFVNAVNRPSMRGPLSVLADTPCMRACVQLIMSIIMLSQRYNVDPPHAAYVLHVCKDNSTTTGSQIVRAHEMPEIMCGGETISDVDADLFRESMYLHVARDRKKQMAKNMYLNRTKSSSSTFSRAQNAFVKKSSKKQVYNKKK